MAHFIEGLNKRVTVRFFCFFFESAQRRSDFCILADTRTVLMQQYFGLANKIILDDKMIFKI